ncbi:MAG: phosphoribosylamine--glycine ligase [Pseudomonadota bacterium]
MKIVIVGSGGREHALAWKIHHSPDPHEVLVLPGNGGTPTTRSLRADDVDGIRRFCDEVGADLVVVGPEVSLAAGLVDTLQAHQLRAFGPIRAATRLESSKVWARLFMRHHGVACPEFWSFGDVDQASAHLERLGGDAVLKYDGLAAGKGVWVCRDRSEAHRALVEFTQRHGHDAAGVVERRLVGKEVSLIGLCDGMTLALLAPSRDHKRLLDDDKGPNTGGMGACTPVADLSPALLKTIQREIIAPTLDGLRAEGLPYCGFLYFGILLSDEGPRLLEYNARLGDPEAEVVLPALDSDLVELMLASLETRLGDMKVALSSDAFIDVVLASKGYPGAMTAGHPIQGLDTLQPDTLVFHAGTARSSEGTLVTAGGRVLNVVARGATVEQARERVYAEVEKLSFEGMTYRRDIGRGTKRT